MAILLSTHSLNVAEELSDRLAIIHRGSIIVAGTLADLREHIGAEQDGLENMFLQITSQVVEH
jgi:ABC-2 type transport system ATP-binding protein